MQRFLLISTILLTVIFSIQTKSPAQPAQNVIALSLEDCIIKALESNLNVAIQVLNPRLAHIAVAQAREQYLPQFSLGLNKRNTNSASYSWLDAASQVETESQFFSAQYSQFVPTGGELTVSLENDENETNRRFQTINPRFGSTLTFDFTQPLLRNLGFKTANREINVAKINQAISETGFKNTLLETIYNVEASYWNLVFSIENLKAREQSLKLAKDLLERNKRSVEIGRLAQIDLQSAVAEVATREADILEAESAVKNNEDILKNIINMGVETDVSVQPVDKPVIEEISFSLDEAIQLARENRPDLQEIKLTVKNNDIDVSYAKNQLLPDLNLQASYWSSGISGTQIVYEDDDPTTGDVIGTIPGESSDAMRDALNFKYQNWTVGLSLEIPINTVFARNQLERARVALEQSKLQLANLEQQILLEIKTANRAVETNLRRVRAYRIARELTEKKLRTEEEKLRLGQATNYDVFLYQRDLSDAQAGELQAIIDYNLSLANRQRVLGISLKEKNVKISELLRD